MCEEREQDGTAVLALAMKIPPEGVGLYLVDGALDLVTPQAHSVQLGIVIRAHQGDIQIVHTRSRHLEACRWRVRIDCSGD